MSRNKIGSLIGASLLTAAMISPANAEPVDYPVQSIRIISPFTAGGTNDFVARISAKLLGEAFNETVVVEQKLGAGGMVGSDLVAKSKPDGYNMVMGSISTHAIAPAVYKNPPFNARADFTPISLVANVPLVLVTYANSDYKTVQDLIAAARKDPDGISHGTPGNGSVPHLATSLFEINTGTKLTHIPYSGEASAVVDLLGERIDLVFANLPSVMGHIRAGTLRPLLVSTKDKVPNLPDVPTPADAGIENFEVNAWYGLFGPAGMDDAVVNKISSVLDAGVKTKEMSDLIYAQGAVPVGMHASEYKVFVAAEQDKWEKVVNDANITIQ